MFPVQISPFNTQDAQPQAPRPDAAFNMEDPRVRGMLLQLGLALMQPTPAGQSTLGHIAQGIGSAGEYVSRNSEFDLKEDLASSRMDTADRRLEQGEQRLGIGRENALTRRGGLEVRKEDSRRRGFSETMRGQHSEARAFEQDTEREAREISKQLANETSGLGSPNPALDRYRGKSYGQILDELRGDETRRAGYSNRRQPPGVPGTIQSSVPEGTIIRNPTSGERRVMKNGRWEPL